MICELWGRGSECNCFLVAGDRLAVIDSGNPDAVLDKVGGLDIPTDYLINTHYHFDHVLGVPVLKERLGGKVALHDEDAKLLEGCDDHYVLSYLFQEDCPKIEVDLRLHGGEVLDLGGVVLEVIHTPGHSPGGICLYEPDSRTLFSGDTVFADGVGRTDFPGGDAEALRKSVEKLIALHEAKGIERILPGHGPAASGKALRNIYNEYF
jgi:hydroxyacylglutathione hydrolase